MTKDRSIALVMLIFVVVMFVESLNISGKSNWQMYSSAFYPRILLAILGLLTILLFINTFRKRKIDSQTSERKTVKELWQNYNKVFLLFVSFGFYIYIMPIVGFIVSTALYLFVGQALLLGLKKRKKVLLNLTVTVIATISVFVIFSYGLNVWLP